MDGVALHILYSCLTRFLISREPTRRTCSVFFFFFLFTLLLRLSRFYFFGERGGADMGGI